MSWTDDLDTTAIMARIGALVAEQQALLHPRLREVRRWERAGLSGPDVVGLVFAGERAAFERVEQLWQAMLAELRWLDQADPEWAARSDHRDDRIEQLVRVLRHIGYCAETPIA